MVQLLRATLNDIRNNIDRHHNIWYMEACNMGRSVGTIANKPRISSTQSYCVSCRDVHFKNPNHIAEIDEYALNVLGDMDDIVKQIAEKNDQMRKKYKVIPGWNDLVKPFKEDAMFWHSIWISAGKL